MTSKASEVLNLFATPVLSFKFEKHDEYVDKWSDWDRDDRRPDGWQCNVNTSFPQVEQDDPYAPMEIVNQLEVDLLANIKKIHYEYGLSLYIKFERFWYNGYYTNQGQEAHHHLSSTDLHSPVWAGVYFAKNCLPGQFQFVKTDYSLRSQGLLNFMDSELNEYYDETYRSNFTDGDIVLFPPHLHHCVRVNDDYNTNKQRLTFSFNVDDVDAINIRNNSCAS